MAAITNEIGNEKLLAEALRRFCRSIELCDDYLRGYYGLKLVSGSPAILMPDCFLTSI